MRIFVYRQYSDKTMITDKKAVELILGHFFRRGTAGAQPFPAGARAPAGPGLAPPLVESNVQKPLLTTTSSNDDKNYVTS